MPIDFVARGAIGKFTNISRVRDSDVSFAAVSSVVAMGRIRPYRAAWAARRPAGCVSQPEEDGPVGTSAHAAVARHNWLWLLRVVDRASSACTHAGHHRSVVGGGTLPLLASGASVQAMDDRQSRTIVQEWVVKYRLGRSRRSRAVGDSLPGRIRVGRMRSSILRWVARSSLILA